MRWDEIFHLTPKKKLKKKSLFFFWPWKKISLLDIFRPTRDDDKRRWCERSKWISKRWKMIDLQHHPNNCTTPPHMEWGPVCRAQPHVKRCCVVVVVVLCKNQIPLWWMSLPLSSGAISILIKEKWFTYSYLLKSIKSVMNKCKYWQLFNNIYL